MHASSTDPRARKLATLAQSVGQAATRNGGELGDLVRTVGRRDGWRRLVNRLYVMSPVLARDADIVHIGWLDAAVRWVDLLEAVSRPIVVSSHGSDLRLLPLGDADFERRLRSVLARVDLLHCVSTDLGERALAFGLDPGKLFVGAWGIDTGYFRPAADPRRDNPRLRVVSVGRVHWVKAYEHALVAIDLLRRIGVDVSYTILGGVDPKARLPVLTAIEDLGLQANVDLRGEATRAEVLAALRSADVFLLTSLSEGVSTATLEAMSVGLPVVVTDVGGMREAVTDGVEGVLVPPRDPQSTAEALAELARDPARRAALGGNGRARAVAAFDVSIRAPAFLAEYRRLAGR
jgi:glycosyltransferase involved in cell wall biosynthesis